MDDDGVRGGMKLITEAQADELRALAKEVGREESSFLVDLFGGTVRSFDEMEVGPGHLAALNMLTRLRDQKRKREAQS
jgi:hypothetical protein